MAPKKGKKKAKEPKPKTSTKPRANPDPVSAACVWNGLMHQMRKCTVGPCGPAKHITQLQK